MNYFCTLFDSNYLARGMAMYESLLQHCNQFTLYVFAFDERCRQLLHQLNLKNIVVISLEEFEDDKLLAIKKGRSKTEYCWTCTPSIILYCLKTYNIPVCTYLDADLYFFAAPDILLSELGQDSVIITEHRYSPEYDLSIVSGKYCVQFMTIKHSEPGLRVLNWWRDACIEWCYNRHEKGKFGDQQYLDHWPTSFSGVHELQNLGGGVAPWNSQQYLFSKDDNDRFVGTKISTKDKFFVVFYHFHGFKIYSDGTVDLGPYKLDTALINTIYKTYINHLVKIIKKLHNLKYIAYDYDKRKSGLTEKLSTFLSKMNKYIRDPIKILYKLSNRSKWKKNLLKIGDFE